MFVKLRLKIRNFIKDHRKAIIIGLLIWLIVLAVNFLLTLRKPSSIPVTSFTPNVSVLDNTSVVNTKKHSKISDVIDQYVNYCNNGEFENAYNLLSTNCKEKAFNNDVNKFKEYAKSIFNQKKRYSIQNYSNSGKTYIYDVKIFNDFLASGLTGEEYAYHQEKFAMVEEGKEMKLNVGNFMDKQDVKRVVEDDYSKIRIKSKAIFYGYEEFSIEIKNKTDYKMVISSVYEGNEILLSLGNITREMTNASQEIVLEPGETREYVVRFSKYADEKEEDQAIILNKIRILKSYSGKKEDAEKEKKNAVKMYSLTIPLV